MVMEKFITDRIRRQYSAKIAAALGCVIAVTLAFAAIFGAHVVSGPAEAAETRAVAALSGLVVVFIMNLGLLGIVLGGNVSLALGRLGDRTERIGEGEFDVDLETDRVDEIGSLYDSVARMRDSLEETLEDLEAEQERA